MVAVKTCSLLLVLLFLAVGLAEKEEVQFRWEWGEEGGWNINWSGAGAVRGAALQAERREVKEESQSAARGACSEERTGELFIKRSRCSEKDGG